jgi:hypothetical protein
VTRTRALLAALLAVVLAGGLTACQSHVGAAAIVDGHRISESDVHKYLNPAGPSANAVAQARQAGGQLLPKTDVLNFLVQERLFSLTLQRNGGLPSNAALQADHEKAVQTLTGQNVTGAQFDTQIAANLLSDGIKLTFLPTLLHVINLEYQLVVRTGATQLSDLGRAVSALKVGVQVNPAYGRWDPKNVAVTEGTAEVPNFITFKNAPANG